MDVWGVMAAQDLLIATVIDQPSCALPLNGSLQVRLLGGQAPYQLMVRNNSGLLISQRIDNGKAPIDLANLSTGKYFLAVTDAKQQVYTDSFYINNQDGPPPAALAANYTLAAGRPLKLDAAADMPDGLLWEWEGPGNFQSFSPQVTVTEPGLYTLRCSKDGCSNEQDVVVTAMPNNILYDVTVYPNPSPSAFNARITLDRPAPVTMAVYAPDGRLVSVQTGSDRAHYLFTGELTASGVYELVFTSGLSKANKRLVIANDNRSFMTRNYTFLLYFACLLLALVYPGQQEPATNAVYTVNSKAIVFDQYAYPMTSLPAIASWLLISCQ